MASEGYPGKYKNGSVIRGISEANNIKGIKVFHAGTKIDSDQNLVSNGGRVLNVTSTGKVFKNIRNKIIKNIRKINWKEGFFRRDIGWRVIKKQ